MHIKFGTIAYLIFAAFIVIFGVHLLYLFIFPSIPMPDTTSSQQLVYNQTSNNYFLHISTTTTITEPSLFDAQPHILLLIESLIFIGSGILIIWRSLKEYTPD